MDFLKFNLKTVCGVFCEIKFHRGKFNHCQINQNSSNLIVKFDHQTPILACLIKFKPVLAIIAP
ncbi:hypothetical protein CAMSH0001_1063 [Campylobacter showae RM3277]|uniref:Uncharacterized protein n=1 Tax=Campylobacter showae RM3277 TaxID=553219 RepID=C6RHV4_9BACT|nr:hypothetical protein CAMSH0001_1063 [Campylobacter showae RM3277]